MDTTKDTEDGAAHLGAAAPDPEMVCGKWACFRAAAGAPRGAATAMGTWGLGAPVGQRQWPGPPRAGSGPRACTHSVHTWAAPPAPRTQAPQSRPAKVTRLLWGLTSSRGGWVLMCGGPTSSRGGWVLVCGGPTSSRGRMGPRVGGRPPAGGRRICEDQRQVLGVQGRLEDTEAGVLFHEGGGRLAPEVTCPQTSEGSRG